MNTRLFVPLGLVLLLVLRATAVDDLLAELSAKREALGAEQQQALADWRTKYVAALDKLARDSAAKGELDTVLAARSEKARLETGDTKPSGIPAIKHLRASFEKGLAVLPRRFAEREQALLRAQVSQLDRLKTAYTKQGKIEEAVRVRDEAAHQLDWKGAGKFGGAIALDGKKAFLEIESPKFDQVGPITLSLWARAAAGGLNLRYARIIHQGDPSGKTPGFGIITYMTSGRVAAIYQRDYTRDSMDSLSQKPLSNETWHHIAMTCDGKTPPVIYINGQDDTAKGPGLTWAANAKQLVIGRRAGSPQQYWKGEVDELLMFNRVLSPMEIAVLSRGP